MQTCRPRIGTTTHESLLYPYRCTSSSSLRPSDEDAVCPWAVVKYAIFLPPADSIHLVPKYGAKVSLKTRRSYVKIPTHPGSGNPQAGAIKANLFYARRDLREALRPHLLDGRDAGI